MKLDRALLLLNLLLVLVSVAAHEVGAEEYSFLLVTAAVSAVVWRRSSRGRPIHLNDTVATLACAAAFAALMYRGFTPAAGEGIRVLDAGVTPVGDFLVVFQWIYLCREKRVRDYFWMYLVTLVHMGTSGLLMPGLAYAFFIVLYAALLICTLAVFHLWRETAAAERVAGEFRVRPAFFLKALPGVLAVLALSAALFALLPRKMGEGPVTAGLIRFGAQPVVGFSSTVHLGEVGTIQDNPQRVMHVTVRDAESGVAVQTESLLLRGVALEEYAVEDGEWTWKRAPPRLRPIWLRSTDGTRLDPMYEDNFPGFENTPHRSLTCDITLEPLDTPVLFAPFAPESLISSRQFFFSANVRTHILATSERHRHTPLPYTVTSRIFDAAARPTGPVREVPEEELAADLALPEQLAPRLRTLAGQIVGSAASDFEKASRILAWLSASSRFAYTTTMTPTPGAEPVEDFLFNLKRGHCEYFASSMVVLLREVGVPARLVNGFKVSEWNPITGAYVVRQQHAHSWAEVFLRPQGWRTFDPSVMRDVATPRPMLARRIGRDLYDWTETLWVTYVVNYEAANQVALYRWLGMTREDIGLGGEELEGGRLRDLLPLIRRVLQVAAGLLTLALAGALAWFAARRALQWRRRRRARPLWPFYGRMERLLARRGFRREESETPLEFAAEVAAAGWPATEAVKAVTERFCVARYGGRAPDETELGELEAALRTIRATRDRRAARVSRPRAGKSSPTAP